MKTSHNASVAKKQIIKMTLRVKPEHLEERDQITLPDGHIAYQEIHDNNYIQGLLDEKPMHWMGLEELKEKMINEWVEVHCELINDEEE